MGGIPVSAQGLSPTEIEPLPLFSNMDAILPLYGLFMNLLFEIYGLSYIQSIDRFQSIVCLGIEPRKYHVGDFGIDNAVHRRHRLLRSVSARPVQGVRSSLD